MNTLMHLYPRRGTLPTGADSTRQLRQAAFKQPQGSTTCWNPNQQLETDLRI
ncbi:hypothetical protein [Streptomyces europaeiscabiei]|uniref:hypothetical protein n=1 Tax=Streptomyces europaeiscabiei TaxID=146819 RepID=UPI002E143766|nr:hypothetical protein OHB30_50380 [Streptomyces europaeiscabiei]